MRTPYAVTFMLVLLLGGTYWFTRVEAQCNLPLSYQIGDIDERFDLTHNEARVALMDAEAVWENATGQNLFRYDEEADFKVNFVFDERQALTEAEKTLRERLDASKDINNAIDDTYATLVKKYNELELQYKDQIEAYERRLNAYNDKVAQYNDSGGAPPDVYEELTEEKEALDREQESINQRAGELNELVKKINRLGEEGNRLVDIHNRHVEVYNETFGDGKEFTQGDFHHDEINVYTFSDRDELVLVLAHELGHAISLGHVEGEASVMYYLMGRQPDELTLSEQDIAAFESVCGQTDAYSRYKEWKQRILNWLQTNGVL